LGRILKWIFFDSRFEEEVEWIYWGQFRYEVYVNYELVRFLRKEKAGEIIGMVVKLPLQNVIRRNDVEGVREDRCPAMRSGT
jgi:hypothetical protein